MPTTSVYIYIYIYIYIYTLYITMLTDDYIVYKIQQVCHSSKRHKQNENTSEGQRIGNSSFCHEGRGKGSGWE